MNRAPVALALTALAVTLMIGMGLVLRPTPNVGPSPNPSPRDSATPEPVATPAQTAHPAAWTSTGAMFEARAHHSATLLPDGTVLVVGGGTRGGGKFQLASAELYDPASGSWTATGSMIEAVDGRSATLLTNGKVLVAGGGHGFDSLVATAELYNPATGTWSATGSMAGARSDHTATLLSDGNVLVVGGFGEDASGTAELYDPASGTWSATGSMAEARSGHTATLLSDGRVLVAGGGSDGCEPRASAELFDPANGTWTATGTMAEARFGHTATLLTNGEVLVASGQNTSCDSSTIGALASAEVFDPATGTWTATGSLIQARPGGSTATLLSDGRVIVAGGSDGRNDPLGEHPLASAELFDPGSGSWAATSSMVASRYYHTATLLPDGTVLVAGGGVSSTTELLASAERYGPGSGT